MTAHPPHEPATENVADPISHNLAGQRLGRKGLETRERILAAMLRLLDAPDGPPLTLSSVAREAAVRLPNLYLYFPDFEALLSAALDRVMQTADEAFINLLRAPWPDELLAERCLEFCRAYYWFWKRNARLLHLRNALSGTNRKIFEGREKGANEIFALLKRQMQAGAKTSSASASHMAIVVLTGFERVATVLATPYVHVMADSDGLPEDVFIERLIEAESRLVEMAIRDQRSKA